MNRFHRLLFLGLFAAMSAMAQDAETDEAAEAEANTADNVQDKVETVAAASPDQPRSMSGMSILGNEEAPKALVIIPWKSSELGDEIGMPEQLDDRATPVDREVFLRELRFYEIRQGDE